ARSRSTCDRCAVGKTRLVASRNRRERSPGVRQTECVLRADLADIAGHLAGTPHKARSTVLLSWLRSLSRLQSRDAARRFADRGRAHFGSRRGIDGGFWEILQEAAVARALTEFASVAAIPDFRAGGARFLHVVR